MRESPLGTRVHTGCYTQRRLSWHQFVGEIPSPAAQAAFIQLVLCSLLFVIIHMPSAKTLSAVCTLLCVNQSINSRRQSTLCLTHRTQCWRAEPACWHQQLCTAMVTARNI